MRLSTLVLLILLAACGSSAAPSTEAASPTPSPTPDLAALREAYLDIADASNEVSCEFTRALRESPTDVALIQQRATENADAYGVAADALRELSFPPELQEDVEDLINSRESLESNFRAIAAAPGASAMEAAISRMFQASSERGSGTINRIREALGLPELVPAEVCDE